MPDVENMVIIAEIFKTTLDELLRDSAVRPKQEMPVYSNETIYDIDCEKHFDVNIGSAATIILSSGTDEKLHIKLSSETLENLDTMFKIKLDVNCMNKNKLSRYEAEDSLTVTITLPDNVLISDSSGSLEFTAKTDYDITIDKITGTLDINQRKAKAIVHLPEKNIVNVINKGRKCDVYYMKEDAVVTYENSAEGENELSISGMFSELIVDLI